MAGRYATRMRTTSATPATTEGRSSPTDGAFARARLRAADTPCPYRSVPCTRNASTPLWQDAEKRRRPRAAGVGAPGTPARLRCVRAERRASSRPSRPRPQRRRSRVPGAPTPAVERRRSFFSILLRRPVERGERLLRGGVAGLEAQRRGQLASGFLRPTLGREHHAELSVRRRAAWLESHRLGVVLDRRRGSATLRLDHAEVVVRVGVVGVQPERR